MGNIAVGSYFCDLLNLLQASSSYALTFWPQTKKNMSKNLYFNKNKNLQLDT